MNLEKARKELFYEKGYNPDSHSAQEFRLATKKDEESKWELHKSYCDRLRTFRFLLDYNAQKRLEKTIDNLMGQVKCRQRSH